MCDSNSKRGKSAAPVSVRDRERPFVVFQPQVHRSLLEGIDLLAEALRPTLGPLPRTVAIAPILLRNPPEILDNGSAIARRIIALPDSTADVGAMLLRHAIARVHNEVGDGTATTAVLFQRIVHEGMRYIAANACNAMRLRHGLERSADIASRALREGALPLVGRDRLVQVALSLCHDPELASLLGEVFDIAGAEGAVLVEQGSGRRLEREYVEGAYWDGSGWYSALMETDAIHHRAVLDDVALLISDCSIQDPGELLPVMELVVRAGIPNLVLLAAGLSESVIGLLLRNREARIIGTLAARAPMTGTFDREALEDMAVSTGGRVIYEAAGEGLSCVRLADLGRARRAWATDKLFGLVGGKGDPRQMRDRMAALRAQKAKHVGDRAEQVRRRLARLIGGTAILRTGGITETELKARKAMAEQAVFALRATIESGIVPGGGTALLDCQRVLVSMSVADDDEDVARRIIGRALEEPLRVIAANAGCSPQTVVARVRAAPRGYGFDASQGQIVDMLRSGIVDSAPVLECALRAAVSGATMALTTDVVVHRKKPPESIEP